MKKWTIRQLTIEPSGILRTFSGFNEYCRLLFDEQMMKLSFYKFETFGLIMKGRIDMSNDSHWQQPLRHYRWSARRLQQQQQFSLALASTPGSLSSSSSLDWILLSLHRQFIFPTRRQCVGVLNNAAHWRWTILDSNSVRHCLRC